MEKENLISDEQIKAWSREVFSLPDSASINVFEEKHTDDKDGSDTKTSISIMINHRNPGTYTILKPVSEICFEDIVFLKKSMESYLSAKHPLRSKLYKFFGWWFIFAGGITVFSVCPVCGQMGCPVGIGTTGILAGILALAKTGGKNFFGNIIAFIKNIDNN